MKREVITTVSLRTQAFCDITACRRLLRGSHCLHY